MSATAHRPPDHPADLPTLVCADPLRCRLWALHDRLEAGISADSCRAEIDSFTRHGQIVPALGRPLHDSPDFDIEIICGARRLYVARHLKQNLSVELREMSDRAALIAMDTENRQRVDISPYERGLSYSRWLHSGQFHSQEDIAHALKVSPAQVSRLLKVARLPRVLVHAFTTPLEICESWGVRLADALEDPQRRHPTLKLARSIAAQVPKPPGRVVFRQLLAAGAKGRRPKSRGHDEVVKDHRGQPLFRIRQLRSCVALLLPVEHLSAKRLAAVRKSVAEALSAVATE
jgi:ParB family chromosome partitioning protein